MPKNRFFSKALGAACLLLLAICMAPRARAQSQLDGIMAVKDESGRTVYVNAPKLRAEKVASAKRSTRSSVLVYWSNKEGRWKPVPPPSPAVMRAARIAANEVTGYVRSQPQTDAREESAIFGTPKKFPHKSVEAALRTPASTDPNYSRLAHGRRISTAEIDEVIAQAAARHGVDPNLVRAVIKVESNFDPRAVSRAGAMGLMQLMPATARKLNVSNPFDPEQNVEAGVQHLSNLLSNYHGDVRLSLAAYNAGETAVARANGVPNFAETKNYVRQITSMYGNPGSWSHPSAAPVRVFRNSQGVLTITNE